MFTESNDYKACVFQSLLVFLCIGAVMLLYQFLGGMVVASLGASSFILFATPHTNSSKSRNLIGGYLCGVFSGVLFGLLRTEVLPTDFEWARYVSVFLCAASAALTTFLMVATKAAHPPSAALALGLTAGSDCVETATAAMIGIIILCEARNILGKHLRNLI